MDPRRAAAHFAAFVRFATRNPGAPREAARYADEHWPAYLPGAHEGLGCLLLTIAAPKLAEARRRRPAAGVRRLRKRKPAA